MFDFFNAWNILTFMYNFTIWPFSLIKHSLAWQSRKLQYLFAHLHSRPSTEGMCVMYSNIALNVFSNSSYPLSFSSLSINLFGVKLQVLKESPLLLKWWSSHGHLTSWQYSRFYLNLEYSTCWTTTLDWPSYLVGNVPEKNWNSSPWWEVVWKKRHKK